MSEIFFEGKKITPEELDQIIKDDSSRVRVTEPDISKFQKIAAKEFLDIPDNINGYCAFFKYFDDSDEVNLGYSPGLWPVTDKRILHEVSRGYAHDMIASECREAMASCGIDEFNNSTGIFWHGSLASRGGEVIVSIVGNIFNEVFEEVDNISPVSIEDVYGVKLKLI